MTNREHSGSRSYAGPRQRKLLGSWRMWAGGCGSYALELEKEGEPLCDRNCGTRSRVGVPGEVYELAFIASSVVLVSVAGLLSSNR